MDYGLVDCDISPLAEVKLLHATIYFYDAPVIHFSTLIASSVTIITLVNMSLTILYLYYQ